MFKMSKSEIAAYESEKALERRVDELVGQVRGGLVIDSDRPRPAIRDGHPLVAGTLRDGRFIYVAAKADGSPMVDEKGDFVVIDPQTGQLREKLNRFRNNTSFAPVSDGKERISGFVDNPGKVPIEMSSGLRVALRDHDFQENASHHEMVQISSLVDEVQKKRLYEHAGSLPNIVTKNRKFLYLIATVAVLTVKVRSFFRWVKTLITRRPDLKAVQLRFSDMLHGRAAVLNRTVMSSSIWRIGSEAGVARTVAMRTYGLSDSQLQRFANMLNLFAENRLWKHGVLAPVGIVRSAVTDLRQPYLLVAHIFTDPIPEDDSLDPRDAVKALNERAGFNVFCDTVGTDVSSDWLRFPW